MPDSHRCPQCGAELAADAPEGLCPQCLLINGIETQPPSDSASAAVPGSPAAQSYHGPFTAPTIDELARHFPQLEIIELLGQGGMGAVYKARQPELDRLVAVKILPPAFAQRFHREARALAKLNHPNVVQVYGLGQTLASPTRGRVGQVFAAHQPQEPPDMVGREDLAHPTPTPDASRSPTAPGEGSLYYFIMEYVEGVNLRQLLQSGQCKPEEALKIVPQICEALQFAHDEGIVHRDIKPENILLNKRGRVKIADFGLAKLLGHTRTDYTLTGPWQVMGTPNYMAPEQFDDPLKVDHRADIYALGVVFYEMLTGELPRGRFPPPSEKVQIDVRLDEVVLRSLEKEPERRYQQASHVKTDVEAISRSPQAASVARPESAKGVAMANAAARDRSVVGRFHLAVGFLAILIGLCGAANIYAPWVEIAIYASGMQTLREQGFVTGRLATAWTPGYGSWHGILVSSLFLGLAAVTLASLRWRGLGYWPTAGGLVGALGIVAVCIDVVVRPPIHNHPDRFFDVLRTLGVTEHERTSELDALQLLARDGKISIGVQASAGPFLGLALGGCMVLLQAFRSWQVLRNSAGGALPESAQGAAESWSIDRAQDRVKAPAIGLLLAGVIAFVSPILPIIGLIVFELPRVSKGYVQFFWFAVSLEC